MGAVRVHKSEVGDDSRRCLETFEDDMILWDLNGLEFGPTPTVFQIGAHMGHLTIALALRFPSMRIFALEPSPLNFRFLVYNLKLKKLTSRVRPLNLVLMKSEQEFQ